MGNCLCKDTPEDLETYNGHQNHAESENTILPQANVSTVVSGDTASPTFKFPTSTAIDMLVLETLGVIGSLVDK